VIGNSGSSTESPVLNHPAMYYSQGCASCYGFLFLEINDKHLHAKYITGNDSILDFFYIQKKPYNVSKENSNLIKYLQISPNPFQNSVNIQYTLLQKSNLKIEIFNSEG